MNGSLPRFSFFPYQTNYAQCVTTLGNFDGCHLGHQALIQNNRSLGEKFHCPDVVLTFDPHPQYFFHPVPDPKELLTTERKSRALQELGVTAHYVLKFNSELNRTEYQNFYKDFLCETLKIRALTVGDDFRFGHNRQGDAHWLHSQGQKDGIQVDIIPPVVINDQTIHSTRIRNLLTQSGDVALAKKMLSHPYSIEGLLVKGEQVGRKLGFPTLNLESKHQIVPLDGVYSGYVWIEGLSPQKYAPITNARTDMLFPAAFSIGTRPTFHADQSKLCVEAHILTPMPPDQEFYNKGAAFYFEQRLRDMIAFKSVEELKQQMAIDVQIAKTSL